MRLGHCGLIIRATDRLPQPGFDSRPPSSRDFLGSDPNNLADPLDHSFPGDPMPSTVRLSILGLDLTSDTFDKSGSIATFRLKEVRLGCSGNREVEEGWHDRL